MRISTYRKHSASGQAIVTLGGRDFYLGPYGSSESKEAYRRRVAEFLASDGVSVPAAQGLKIGDLADAYLQAAKKEFGGEKLSRRDLLKTAYNDARLGVRALVRLYSNVAVTEFGPHSLKAIRVDLLDQHNHKEKQKDGRPKQRLSRSVVNRRIRSVTRIFKWGVSESLVPASLWHALKSVEGLRSGKCDAPENDAIKPVPDNVVQATLNYLPEVVGDMVRFQLLVGCRPGEVCSITPGMIDRSGEVWEAHLDRHKSAWRGKKRILYIGPNAQSLLSKYLDRDPDQFCFSPCEAMNQRLAAKAAARVTPENQGNRQGYSKQTRQAKRERRRHRKLGNVSDGYTTGSYGKAIAYACRLAFPAAKELDAASKKEWYRKHRWAPNQLRHSAATRIRRSHGLEAASLILGHAELSVTQIYAEADRDKAIAVTLADG